MCPAQELPIGGSHTGNDRYVAFRFIPEESYRCGVLWAPPQNRTNRDPYLSEGATHRGVHACGVRFILQSHCSE